MSYQTGTALHIDDLLAQLSTFAQANGWTQNKVVAGSGDGASSELYLSKGASFFIFDAQLTVGANVYHGVNQILDHPFLWIYGATGFDGGAAADAQPGTAKDQVQTNWLLPNMTAYHFFTDSTKTYLHVVVEVTANEFRHFHVGLLDKIGVFDGGEYVTGTSPIQNITQIDQPGYFQDGQPFTLAGSTNTFQFLRANIDGFNWKIGNSTTTAEGWRPPLRHQGQGEPLDNFMDTVFTTRLAQPNTFNTTVILFPIPCHIVRSATQWTPVGKPFDMRCCNIKNVTPGALITFGADEWLIFPHVFKKDPATRDDLPNSGFLGWAYLKVP